MEGDVAWQAALRVGSGAGPSFADVISTVNARVVVL